MTRSQADGESGVDGMPFYEHASLRERMERSGEEKFPRKNTPRNSRSKTLLEIPAQKHASKFPRKNTPPRTLAPPFCFSLFGCLDNIEDIWILDETFSRVENMSFMAPLGMSLHAVCLLSA